MYIYVCVFVLMYVLQGGAKVGLQLFVLENNTIINK